MVYIKSETQDCVEDNCVYWDLDHNKCKWMHT
jgi:hypothetical protein